MATELVTTTHEIPGERSGAGHTAPQQPVQRAHRGVERDDDGELVEAAGEDVSGQDLLEVLGALRRTVDQEDRSRGRDDIDDADQRFLGHARRPGPHESEQHGGEQREGE
jgi:hypothetical protein